MTKPKILVVEDEGVVAINLEHILGKLGYDVSELCASGEIAIVKASEIRPDLVLMDIVLQGEMDGIQAAEHIRSQFDIPVVYLTAYAEEDILQRAMVTQPFGYILKPIEERELHTTIEMALYKHSMEKRLKENKKWLETTLRSIGDAVVTTDTEGRITFMNPVAEALTGWRQAEALGKRLNEVVVIVNEDIGAPVEHPSERVLREGTVVGQTNHPVLIASNGTEVPVDDNTAPIQDDEGNVTGVVLVFRDVTRRMQAEEALRESEIRFRDLVETIEECIWEADPNGVYTYMSPRARDTYGYEPEELLGNTLFDLMSPEEARQTSEVFKQRAAQREPFKWLKSKCFRKDGRMVIVETSGVPYFDTNGKFLGYKGVDRDVSERRWTEDAVRGIEAKYRALFNNVADPIFIFDRETKHILDCNASALERYGYRLEELLMMTPLDLLPPHELERVKKNLDDEEDTSSHVYTHVTKSGERFQVEIRTEAFEYLGRKAWISIDRDITTRKQMDEALKLNATVFESAAEGIFITDPDFNIITINPAFSEITGYTLDEVAGKNPGLLTSDRQDDELFKNMWETLRKTGQWGGEVWDRRKDGSIYPESLSISAVENDMGEVINYVGMLSDITERKQTEKRLQYLATHDPLTDLPNRTLFYDRLSHALTKAKRESRYVAVMFLDLDGFKSVNDTFGHEKGDHMLQIVAERLKSCLRGSDTVARLSGDEFTLCLEAISSPGDATLIAEKIITTLPEPMHVEGQEFSITTSIGISFFPLDGDSAESLVKNADAAMYLAKKAGKNTYHIFSS